MPYKRSVIEDFPALVKIVAAFPEGDQKEVMRIFIDPKHKAEAVASTLCAWGHKISASTIRTYRRELARQEKANEHAVE